MEEKKKIEFFFRSISPQHDSIPYESSNYSGSKSSTV